jgi:hypothetical protein
VLSFQLKEWPWQVRSSAQPQCMLSFELRLTNFGRGLCFGGLPMRREFNGRECKSAAGSACGRFSASLDQLPIGAAAAQLACVFSVAVPLPPGDTKCTTLSSLPQNSFTPVVFSETG